MEQATPSSKPDAPQAINWYSGWRLMTSAAIGVVAAKLIGIIGALVALPLFFWLQPRRGAVLASTVAVVSGAAVAFAAGFALQYTASYGQQTAAPTAPHTSPAVSTDQQLDAYCKSQIEAFLDNKIDHMDQACYKRKAGR